MALKYSEEFKGFTGMSESPRHKKVKNPHDRETVLTDAEHASHYSLFFDLKILTAHTEKPTHLKKPLKQMCQV